MNKVNAVLCTVQYDESRLEKITKAFAPAPVYFHKPKDSDGIKSVIQKVDVAVLESDLDDLILEGKNLRWIHCSHSGLTRSARKEVFERGIILTGAAGRSAPSLAEHALFFAMAFTYDVYGLHDGQKARDLESVKKRYVASRGLNGQTMGIIGYGNTGQALAKRAKALDMRVLVYSRSRREQHEFADEYYAMDKGDTIGPLLRESDFLVLCCHLSDETWHMLGDEQFRMMKKTAVLINMARGGLVDEKALYRALREQVIAGAGCDVFDEEPLPPESPFWDLPNIIITPHASPRVPNISDNALNILLDNVERYIKGESLKNRLSERDMYTK